MKLKFMDVPAPASHPIKPSFTQVVKRKGRNNIIFTRSNAGLIDSVADRRGIGVGYSGALRKFERLKP